MTAIDGSIEQAAHEQAEHGPPAPEQTAPEQAASEVPQAPVHHLSDQELADKRMAEMVEVEASDQFKDAMPLRKNTWKLYYNMKHEYKFIYNDLKQNGGTKTKCWLWWVFPVNYQGDRDRRRWPGAPGIPTVDTTTDALYWLIAMNNDNECHLPGRKPDTLFNIWISIIDMIVSVPDADVPRIKSFYREWSEHLTVDNIKDRFQVEAGVKASAITLADKVRPRLDKLRGWRVQGTDFLIGQTS